MIEVFEILTSLYDIAATRGFFTINERDTRRNPFKIVAKKTRTTARQNFFTVAAINDWNSLPETVISSESVHVSVIMWNSSWHKLDCYNLKQKNLNPNENGRGMLFYIRKDIDYKEINDESGFEELQVYNLLLTRRDVVIASTYRSPSSTPENSFNLYNFLESIGSSLDSRYIVLGDMNYRDIDWQYISTNHDENSKEH